MASKYNKLSNNDFDQKDFKDSNFNNICQFNLITS